MGCGIKTIRWRCRLRTYDLTLFVRARKDCTLEATISRVIGQRFPVLRTLIGPIASSTSRFRNLCIPRGPLRLLPIEAPFPRRRSTPLPLLTPTSPSPYQNPSPLCILSPSRPPIRSITKRPNQQRHMIMLLPILGPRHEPNLDVGPETLDPLGLVVSAYVEPERPAPAPAPTATPAAGAAHYPAASCAVPLRSCLIVFPAVAHGEARRLWFWYTFKW